MRFLLDESADYPLVNILREEGYDVTAIAHDYPHALRDTEVLTIAVKEERIIITNDLDFGELIVRRRLHHRGVILFRLGNEDLSTKMRWLKYILANYSEDLRELIVITEDKVRIRRFRAAP